MLESIKFVPHSIDRIRKLSCAHPESGLALARSELHQQCPRRDLAHHSCVGWCCWATAGCHPFLIFCMTASGACLASVPCGSQINWK
mmetsp:Transcript_22065/g.50400  ORF Transcript_22065/g.50400 Transcript_22065/m.50400 type:complete len:87 (-) Transcript_22065:86-346(-)